MAYSAAQLINLACQICECPGRATQAGMLLNMTLANYAQTMDLDTIRVTTTLNIGPQADTPHFYSLPANYLRMYDIFYNILGEIFTPKQWELQELDAAYTASGIANYPQNWATNMSATPPQIAFYPPPAIPLVLTLRYRPQTSDIATPETSAVVPWFPNQIILLKDLCMQLGDVVDDDRSPRWEQEVERKMRKYLIMDDDKEGFSQTVKLDNRFFRTGASLPPSKKLGF